jgi:hypothetical protein
MPIIYERIARRIRDTSPPSASAQIVYATLHTARMNRGSGPRRGSDPGIVRVTLPPNGNGERGGYRATARLPNEVLVRMFFDSAHGGPDEAHVAARAWRADQLAAAAVPDHPTRRIVLKPRTPSGIVGVHRRGRGWAAWIATYDTTAGDRFARSFSVGRYGEAEARSLAIEQRQTWEMEDLGRALPAMQEYRFPAADCLDA